MQEFCKHIFVSILNKWYNKLDYRDKIIVLPVSMELFWISKFVNIDASINGEMKRRLLKMPGHSMLRRFLLKLQKLSTREHATQVQSMQIFSKSYIEGHRICQLGSLVISALSRQNRLHCLASRFSGLQSRIKKHILNLLCLL